MFSVNHPSHPHLFNPRSKTSCLDSLFKAPLAGKPFIEEVEARDLREAHAHVANRDPFSVIHSVQESRPIKEHITFSHREESEEREL